MTPFFEALAFLSLSAVPGAPAAETFVFQPEQGSRIEKVWTTKHNLRAVEMNRSLGEQSREYQSSTGITSEEVLGVVDEYLVVDGSPPRKFRREFNKGKRTSRLVGPKGSGEKIRQKCLLRGHSAVFTWVEEEGEYGRYCDSIEELDEDVLGELRADLDLAFLLPAEPAAPGQGWLVAPEALIDLFGRSGTLPYKLVPGKDDFLLRALDSGVAGALDQAFGGTAEGAVQVTFRELRESDAGRIAVLDLACNVQYERDRTAYVQAKTVRQEVREGIEYRRAFLRLAVEGQGEVLWNLDENRPEGLSFEGLETAYASITHRAPSDDEGVERSQDVTMQGPLVISAAYARVP